MEAKYLGVPIEITNSIGMKLVFIPSGELMMGSHESAQDTAEFFNRMYHHDRMTANGFDDEHPEHRVRITKPFYLGACHVTRGQFRKFVADTGYMTDVEKPGTVGWDSDNKRSESGRRYSWRYMDFEQTDEHPVVDVSWNDAVAFCLWLSGKEGKTYRLPTEAEWEYACRAGTTTRYYWGDYPEWFAKVANEADAKAMVKLRNWLATKDSGVYRVTAPAGSFAPNAFGLYDMHGNGWQWCSDWYDEKSYAASPRNDSNRSGLRKLPRPSWR